MKINFKNAKKIDKTMENLYLSGYLEEIECVTIFLCVFQKKNQKED